MGLVELSNLNLGEDKAESEAKELTKYFISTPTYINAKNEFRRKTYYIGQRGAGKSALFNKLSGDYSKNGKAIILKITPDDFSYEKFRNLEHNYTDMRAVYGYVWHYTLLTDMFRGAVDYYEEHSNLKTNKDNVQTLRNYLESKNALTNQGFLDTFLTFFGEFTSDKNLNTALKVGSNQQNRSFIELSNLSELILELKAFRNITDNHHLYMFIDELDTGWDNTKEATNFIHGLFYAVRQVKKLSNVTIFISLRSDMYNDLSSILPDPEKMRGEIERFSWNPSMLRSLIAERIIVNYPTMDSETSDNTAISTVFEDGVLEYIIEHSLQRPREIIQFCKDVLNQFNATIYDSKRLDKITLALVKSIEPSFSLSRLDYLCREYEHQYPDLYTFLSYFGNAKEYYSMSEFKTNLEDVMLYAVEKLGENSWLGHNFNTTKLIEILFEIGFIKLFSERFQKYLAYYEGSFLNIENVSQVKIHDVFVSALQCN